MITSASNPTLKLVRKLLAQKRKREELGLFAVEGEDLVEAASAAGIEPIELLVAGETVEPELLAAVSTLAHPARVVGVYRTAALPREPRETTLALWRVADPGNVGTLLRAATRSAPRWRSRRAAPTRSARRRCAPRPARSSASRCWPSTTRRATRVALVAHGAPPLHELALSGPTTFVLGAERDGLPQELVDASDHVATIATSGAAESLNVAVAGAIALYERSRRG